MVATPEKLHATHSHDHLPSKDRVAVLLMGYGEVESYEDFANYNEQALNLLTAKFAPVPTWIYPPLAKLLALFDRHEWGHTHHDFISPHNAIFERQRAGIEHELQHKWGNSVQVFKAFNFCAPFLPNQVLAEIKEFWLCNTASTFKEKTRVTGFGKLVKNLFIFLFSKNCIYFSI